MRVQPAGKPAGGSATWAARVSIHYIGMDWTSGRVRVSRVRRQCTPPQSITGAERMTLSRRDFLTGSGATLAATLVPGRLLAALEQHTRAPEPLLRWSDVRAQFPLTQGYLHFSSFFI